MSEKDKKNKGLFGVSRGTKIFLVAVALLFVLSQNDLTQDKDSKQKSEDKIKATLDDITKTLQAKQKAMGIDPSKTIQIPDPKKMGNANTPTNNSLNASPTVSAPAMASFQKNFDELWTQMQQVNVRDKKFMQQPSWSRMALWVQQEPFARKELLQRFIREENDKFRIRLRELLRTLATDDVALFFVKLLDDKNPAVRREALYLLQGALAHSSKVQEKMRQLLRNETDEQALIMVLSTLYPTLQITPQELGEVGDRLMILARHPNPGLRIHSLKALVQFDRSAAAAEDFLFKALSDRDQNVRAVAVSLINEERLQSERIKGGLLRLLESPNETQANRNLAVRTLSFFRLNDVESALIAKYYPK